MARTKDPLVPPEIRLLAHIFPTRTARVVRAVRRPLIKLDTGPLAWIDDRLNDIEIGLCERKARYMAKRNGTYGS